VAAVEEVVQLKVARQTREEEDSRVARWLAEPAERAKQALARQVAMKVWRAHRAHGTLR